MLDIHIEQKEFPGRTPGVTHCALRDVHFSVASGEFACLVGPSGCGKSTLLSIIGGLDRTVRGTVQLDGSDPAAAVSYMFQTPRLMPWLTVLENVCLVLDGSQDADSRARNLLQAMHLGDVLNAYPNRLSGGMQRRAALARAFAVRPKLLLLDEPFVSLDLPVANRLRAMLVELWQEQRPTLLFVTHDLREALALGDRVLFMSASPGQIVWEQTIELPRPRDVDAPDVVELQQSILSAHPQLLAGLTGNPAPQTGQQQRQGNRHDGATD